MLSYKILEVLEFSSDRKRMSVIVVGNDGTIFFEVFSNLKNFQEKLNYFVKEQTVLSTKDSLLTIRNLWLKRHNSTLIFTRKKGFGHCALRTNLLAKKIMLLGENITMKQVCQWTIELKKWKRRWLSLKKICTCKEPRVTKNS